jgi:hypothetical protein
MKILQNLQKNDKYGIILIVYGNESKEVENMSAILVIMYLLIFAIFALIGFAIFQIKLAGMKVKDFWGFIEANQMLDKLYRFAMQYQSMSSQEQIIYLSEAEKIFTAFDKVPPELWEEEYDKYRKVLTKYNDLKMIRWASN